ncbi:hypothetical protein OHT52_22555 [Streptomyces sp. NBC_00247]|uniref:hypothetical protein n=1 Tax=Streptomyces sp. NBC_00247 TaxID=2975689 RepID=UPI002E297B4D|nr:hypothetical protein [Streptomyces sp. NBC_00247]
MGPGGSSRKASVLDEHLVVDVDDRPDAYLLDCADVLRAGGTYSLTGALRRLAGLTSAHPACGIAAVPLTGTGGVSGWALAGGSDRTAALVASGSPPPYQGSADPLLLPSCAHAWLVAGRSLRDWPFARVVPLDRAA